MGLMYFEAGKPPTKVFNVSAELTASGVAVAARCAFAGIVIKNDGSNDVTVNVYDNASAASGTKLLPADCVFPANANLRLQSFSLLTPIPAQNGVYVEVTCAGTFGVMVYYDN